MRRLVNSENSATGEPQVREKAPGLTLNLAAPGTGLVELPRRFHQVVAHKKELLAAAVCRRMHRQLGGGHRENQPPVPRVDIRKLEDIAKERPILLRVATVDNMMDSIYHGAPPGA